MHSSFGRGLRHILRGLSTAAGAIALQPIGTSARDGCPVLSTPEDLAALGQAPTALLIRCREDAVVSHGCAAVEASLAAAAHPSGVFTRCLRRGVTPASVEEYLIARFALYEPLTAVVLKSYLATGKKWIADTELTSAASHSLHALHGSATDFLHAALSESRPPTAISAPRPAGDASPLSPHVIEVVASTFQSLVASSRTPVLLEAYTPTCDACKAFAPRFRMLAALLAAWTPSVTVAVMDILRNDRPREHMPDSGTPSLRLYGATLGPMGVAWRGEEDPTQAFPTLPQALRFVLQHAAPREVAGMSQAQRDALMRRAEEAEADARVLEQLYLQSMAWMAVWQEYTQSGHAREDTARDLREAILSLYAYILEESGPPGSVPTAMALAETVHSMVEALPRA